MKKKKVLAAVFAGFMFCSAAQPASAEPYQYNKDSFGPKTFDLQAHRGGMGLNVESSVPSSPMLSKWVLAHLSWMYKLQRTIRLL